MQELVVESLMVSLAMVMLDVLVDDEAQMTLAEWDDSIETLLLDRPDEPLGIGIEIGTLRRKSDRLNAAARQDLAKDTSVKGISVVNQMPRSPQEAIDRVGQIAGLLLHPRAARLRMDPGDGHAAGLQLDHEEDKIPPEPCQRQHLDREQIAGRQAVPVALVHGSRALGEPRSTSWPSWRQQVHDLDMKSRVHPKYKTQYHVGNWPAYDRALVQRGDITVWLAPDAIATWEAVGVGKRGGQRPYSDLAIETALTLRLIFHLPLRQTEGFLTSIFGMLGLDLSAPDHTTLSRRGQHLDLPLRRAPAGAGLHLIVDSTGLSIVGEGEWAAAKHGGRGRRGWKKLHLGVDRSGVIVARALTEASVDDATTGITLIEATDGALGRVTADAAYDTIGFYEAAGARGATVVVPPTRTANVSRYGPRSSARDRTILAVKERGRRRWKQTSGYHGQARVENAFFRYKSIIGDSLRACSPAGRGTEVVLACNILNQMTGLGRPMSYRIGR